VSCAFDKSCIEDNTKKASEGSSRKDKGSYGGSITVIGSERIP
jgi:hypothetical protein